MDRLLWRCARVLRWGRWRRVFSPPEFFFDFCGWVLDLTWRREIFNVEWPYENCERVRDLILLKNRIPPLTFIN